MLCNCRMASCVVAVGRIKQKTKKLFMGFGEWSSAGEDAVLQWNGMLCCSGWESSPSAEEMTGNLLL